MPISTKCGGTKGGKDRLPGTHQIRRRVCWLVEKLGESPSKVCKADNLIFPQKSESSGELSFEKWANECWRVHEYVLDLVRPRAVIAFGNGHKSPYQYLISRHPESSREDELESGHGNWPIKMVHVRLNAQPMLLIGLPHFSRYAVEKLSSSQLHRLRTEIEQFGVA